MKSLLGGCLAVLIGGLAGAALVLAVGFAFRSGAVQTTPVPNTAPAAGRPDVTITARADYVDTEIRQALVRSGLVRNATVSLASPNLVNVGTVVPVSFLGQSIALNVNMTMALAVNQGKVVVNLSGVQAEGMNVPSSLLSSSTDEIRALGEEEINVQLQRALQGTGLHLTAIRVTPDSMSVDLSRN